MPMAPNTGLRDLPADDPMRAYLTGATPFFRLEADHRFSYCLYVPPVIRGSLVVAMHGARRDAGAVRDALMPFAAERGCTVLVPLLSMTPADPASVHNFKEIDYNGVRYDLVVLKMVEEVRRFWGLEAGRFCLLGFSAGGQFAHRFLYLHPRHLAAISICAPGRITRPDSAMPWPEGWGGIDNRFGLAPEVAALRTVPAQLVVGSTDTAISPTAGAPLPPGVAARNRIENARTLVDDYTRLGMAAELAVVPNVGHSLPGVLPAAAAFLSRYC